MSTSKVFLNYTDYHDVDEDVRTITAQGGDWGLWWGETFCGVSCRFIQNDSTDSGEHVASSNMKNM